MSCHYCKDATGMCDMCRPKRSNTAMTMPTKFDSWLPPTQGEVDSACMSFRHDFGLLSEDEKQRLRFDAKEWLHAWRKELKQ